MSTFLLSAFPTFSLASIEESRNFTPGKLYVGSLNRNLPAATDVDAFPNGRNTAATEVINARSLHAAITLGE